MEKSKVAVNQQGQALSYVIGVYFGDGCVTLYRTNNDQSENRCFALQVIDEDFRDYVAKQCQIAFPESNVQVHNIYREDKGRELYHLRVGLIGHYIESITGKKTIIPNFVYESIDNIKAFLEGLLDSEGWITDTAYLKRNEISCVIGLAITSELAWEFKNMFQGLGIKVGKIGTRKLPSGKVIKQMHFNTGTFFNSGLMFHSWRKAKKLIAHRSARSVLESVRSIKNIPAGVSFNDYLRSLRLKILEDLKREDDIVWSMWRHIDNNT